MTPIKLTGLRNNPRSYIGFFSDPAYLAMAKEKWSCSHAVELEISKPSRIEDVFHGDAERTDYIYGTDFVEAGERAVNRMRQWLCHGAAEVGVSSYVIDEFRLPGAGWVGGCYVDPIHLENSFVSEEGVGRCSK